jgi:hypothetical protein
MFRPLTCPSSGGPIVFSQHLVLSLSVSGCMSDESRLQLFNLYGECRTKEALDGIGDFKIGGQIIQILKHADDLVLMAKE